MKLEKIYTGNRISRIMFGSHFFTTGNRHQQLDCMNKTNGITRTLDVQVNIKLGERKREKGSEKERDLVI